MSQESLRTLTALLLKKRPLRLHQRSSPEMPSHLHKNFFSKRAWLTRLSGRFKLAPEESTHPPEELLMIRTFIQKEDELPLCSLSESDHESEFVPDMPEKADDSETDPDMPGTIDDSSSESGDDPDHEFALYNHEAEDLTPYDFLTDDAPDLAYLSGPTTINPEPALPASYSLQDCISRAQREAALSSEPIVEKQEKEPCEEEAKEKTPKKFHGRILGRSRLNLKKEKGIFGVPAVTSPSPPYTDPTAPTIAEDLYQHALDDIISAV